MSISRSFFFVCANHYPSIVLLELVILRFVFAGVRLQSSVCAIYNLNYFAKYSYSVYLAPELGFYHCKIKLSDVIGAYIKLARAQVDE